MESSNTAELDIPELNAAASKAMFTQEWPTTLYFQSDSYVTKASYFQTCLGDSLQFLEVSTSERPSRLGQWPLAYQFGAR
jgi:hypothetical protein